MQLWLEPPRCPGESQLRLLFQSFETLHVTEKNPEMGGGSRSHGGLLSCWDARLCTALFLPTSPAVGSFLPYFHQPDRFSSSLFLWLLSLFPYPSAFQLCQVWVLNRYLWDHMLWLLTCPHPSGSILHGWSQIFSWLLFLLTDFLPNRTALPLPPLSIFLWYHSETLRSLRVRGPSHCEIDHIDSVTERHLSDPSCERMPIVMA